MNRATMFVGAPAVRLSKGLSRRNVMARPAITRMSTVPDATRAAIKEHNVMVFSKSWCPFCNEVKGLFKQSNIEYTAWELDQREDGAEVQDFLQMETNQRTVPNVFIGGEHVGGCDDTMALYFDGALMDKVDAKAT